MADNKFVDHGILRERKCDVVYVPLRAWYSQLLSGGSVIQFTQCLAPLNLEVVFIIFFLFGAFVQLTYLKFVGLVFSLAALYTSYIDTSIIS